MRKGGAPMRPGVAIAVAALVAALLAGAAAAEHRTQRYPSAIYPAARSFPDWGYRSGCPSLRNVRRLGPGARRGALRAVRHLDGIASHDRRWADRAYWPALQSSGDGDVNAARPGHHRGHRARKSGYASLLAHNCGAAIVRRSWWIATAPDDPETHPGLARHYFL